MDGPISGVGMAGPMMPMTGYAATGNYLAGGYPGPAAGMGYGGAVDPFGQSGVIPMRAALPNDGPVNPALMGNEGMPDNFGFADVPEGPSMRRAGRTAASRRQAARKSSRRPTTPAKRRP
jgi:hypothetical protein